MARHPVAEGDLAATLPERLAAARAADVASKVPYPIGLRHLRVLRSARLVRSERRGREIEYSLMDVHVGHLIEDALAHTGEDGTTDDAADPTLDEGRTPDHEPVPTRKELS